MFGILQCFRLNVFKTCLVFCVCLLPCSSTPAHHYYRVCLMTRPDLLRLKHSLNTSLDYVEDDDDAFEPHSPYRYPPLSSVMLYRYPQLRYNMSYYSTALSPFMLQGLQPVEKSWKPGKQKKKLFPGLEKIMKFEKIPKIMKKSWNLKKINLQISCNFVSHLKHW